MSGLPLHSQHPPVGSVPTLELYLPLRTYSFTGGSLGGSALWPQERVTDEPNGFTLGLSRQIHGSIYLLKMPTLVQALWKMQGVYCLEFGGIPKVSSHFPFPFLWQFQQKTNQGVGALV